MIRVFLSASVPLPDRHPQYHASADILAIRDAVKALFTTALVHGRIVFGGHPAITPLVALLMRGMSSEVRRRVILYQSSYFEADFPEDVGEFIEIRVVPEVRHNKEASLAAMRDAMIRSDLFDAGIFIGGMEGVIEECRLFREVHPRAPFFPIASTGAAALRLHADLMPGRRDLLHEITYPTLFRNLIREIEARKA